LTLQEIFKVNEVEEDAISSKKGTIQIAVMEKVAHKTPPRNAAVGI
jgi:hypothetical protein